MCKTPGDSASHNLPEGPPVLSAFSNLSSQVFATEKSAKTMLCQMDTRYQIPTAAQKKALLIGFAKCGKALPGAAFDAVRTEGSVDLDDSDDIAVKNQSIVLIEIKSCGQDKIASDLSGYFFNITSAELLVAQSLKEQYRFVFFNTVRSEVQELTIGEILGRAKSIYPAFHIRL